MTGVRSSCEATPINSVFKPVQFAQMRDVFQTPRPRQADCRPRRASDWRAADTRAAPRRIRSVTSPASSSGGGNPLLLNGALHRLRDALCLCTTCAIARPDAPLVPGRTIPPPPGSDAPPRPSPSVTMTGSYRLSSAASDMRSARCSRCSSSCRASRSFSAMSLNECRQSADFVRAVQFDALVPDARRRFLPPAAPGSAGAVSEARDRPGQRTERSRTNAPAVRRYRSGSAPRFRFRPLVGAALSPSDSGPARPAPAASSRAKVGLQRTEI